MPSKKVLTREQILSEVRKLNDIFAAAAVGDFSKDVKVPAEEDDLTELPVGVQLMTEVVREKISELADANVALETRVAVRTRDLEASESQLRSIVENVPNFIEILDLDFIVLDVNRVVPGGKKEAVIGKPSVAYLTPEEAKISIENFKKVVKTGKPLIFESSAFNKHSGVTNWYKTSVGPITEDGKITGLVLVATDITPERAREKVLKERSTDLEKFNALMVGRELKMMELKVENEKLRKRLNPEDRR